MAGLGPCVLPVLEFANARAPELQALHELSQDKQVSNCTDVKVETQKNQRRRRANAFKSHKMPQRLRITPKNRVKNSLRCRKHDRRPHKLLQDRSNPSVADSKRPLWLSSHVWHAKRMIMTEQYGYILASHRADKSVSAALQALRTKATVHDASYYGIIELYGLPQVILEALQLVSDPEGSDFHGLRFLAGAEEGRSMLYHLGQFPLGAITPVTFMWRPLRQDYEGGEFTLQEDWQNMKRQLWLWVHPAAYMEAATAIASACQEVGHDDEENIEMLDRRGQLCRLKLRGRLADELVAGIASSDGDGVSGEEEQDIQEEDASDHEDGFNEKQTRMNCCNGNRLYTLREVEKKIQGEQKDSIYAVAVKDPRIIRWKHGNFYRSTDCVAGLSLLKEPPAETIAKVGTDVIESPLSGLSLSSLGKDAEEPKCNEILKEIQALLAWTTNTSNAVEAEEHGSLHLPNLIADGERTKLDVAEDDSGMDVKPIPNSLLWSLSKRLKIESKFCKDQKLNEEIYRQRKESVLGSTSYGVRARSQALHLLIIKKHEPYPHTSGWDIICPPSSVAGLLKTLAFGGALVVGLKEDAALCTVLHQPSFPCDYPDTKAGQVYWEARARDLDTEQAKKPKAVRFNFEKHGVKSPFRPRWELLFNLQKHEGDAEDEDMQAPCVLRGEKYMEPFCFHRSSTTATWPGEATLSTPPFGVESIVPVTIPTLVRVVIVVPRRGNIDVNAMLLMPSAEDVEQFNNKKSWKGFDVCLPKKNRVERSIADERSLIGYVTSTIYDRPKGAFRAVGFIACEPLQQLYLANPGQQYRKPGHYVLAMLRSPHGRMVRPVLVQAQT